MDLDKIKFSADKAKKITKINQIEKIDPLEKNIFYNLKNIYSSIKNRTTKGLSFLDYEVSAFEKSGGICDPLLVANEIKKILENDGYNVVRKDYVIRIIWMDQKENKKTSTKKTKI